jgi:hypothetical protein
MPQTNIKVMPVVEYARAHTKTAIQVLVDLMMGAEKEATRLGAAVAILNRGWGTPPQSLVVQGEIQKEFDMSNMSEEELRTFHTLLGKVVPAADVVSEDEMPNEKTMKNVTTLVPRNPDAQEQ